MSITARYRGCCTSCGRSITIGEQIEWVKGQAPHHTACTRVTTGRPYGRREPDVVYSSRPAVSRHLPAPQPGEQIIHRDRPPYQVGQTIHATRVQGGGGPDSCYWTVRAAGSHRISQFEDDTREGERLYDAIVRAATDDEAASCASRIAQAQAPTAARAAAEIALTTGESMGRGWQRPVAATRIAHEVQVGSSASLPYLLAAADGTVYSVRPVYDDDPVVLRLTMTVTDARAIAETAGWVQG